MDLNMMLADKEYEDQVEGIKKLIISFNELNLSKDKTFEMLEKRYGDNFSKEQLQAIMNQVK